MFFALILCLTAASNSLASATTPPALLTIGANSTPRASLTRFEGSLDRMPAHVSEFASVSSGPMSIPQCANVRPPEALLTPDPMLPANEEGLLVRVSFIVGSDGQVHSAFVLSSPGVDELDEDVAILRAVRGWRYRPALCNGVPTESEARVQFSVRE